MVATVDVDTVHGEFKTEHYSNMIPQQLALQNGVIQETGIWEMGFLLFLPFYLYWGAER